MYHDCESVEPHYCMSLNIKPEKTVYNFTIRLVSSLRCVVTEVDGLSSISILLVLVLALDEAKQWGGLITPW